MSENFNEFEQKPKDELSTGLKVLSFCIPLAGAIIYFTKKEKEPNAAQSACYAALIGMAVGLVFNVLMRVGGMS
ncbi:hypothetical protein ACFO3U_12950 [Flavobacterium ponti]|jgi:FtsH-binding integral membrane protein|uniref:Uncharacterized protein n=1 Tax=Flavobacterium ponti TaxID=665133 RepID=A0ABV9P5S4_9FLAO